MEDKNETVMTLLHKQRKYYARQQKFHYMTFAIYSLILMLDFLVIIYIRAVSLNAYAWAGIIFLFVLMGIEAKQYSDFKSEKQKVDDFYMAGEYEGNK